MKVKIKVGKKNKLENLKKKLVRPNKINGKSKTNGVSKLTKKTKLPNIKMHVPNTSLEADEENYSNSEIDDIESESGSEDSENNIFVKNEDTDSDTEDKSHEESSEDNSEDEIQSHKQSLAKLKQTDPDFYKFLQDNDNKLLEFNLSDSEGEDEEDKLHKPEENLEIASDESDFEDEESQRSNKVITLRMLKTWQTNLQTDKTNKTIGYVIKAFHAALIRVSNTGNQEEYQYKVDGSSVFNAVIQLCVLELGPAIRRFLGLTSGTKQIPHKCKRFVKIKTLLKSYFTDLLKLLGGVTSANILTVLLKHIHYISPMFLSFPVITKLLLKKLVHIWGTSAETVRVIAFLCILRITTNQQANLLDSVLKTMYMTYVKNSKFVSPNTLSVINFMRRSLVEIFALDVNVSYQYVFLYIRQLAIHLRNAITDKKKENIQAVYNWQFINSLKLWGSLFAVTCNKPQLQPLVYPFVQVCLGTIKLLPTFQYFPLRFHIVQILMDLTRDTGVFVPVLPFMLEALTIFDFNKKHTKVSMKPLQFTCILRLSKSQLSENGFKDTSIDTVYGLLLEYLANQSYSIAFPDISLFCIIQLKEFLKKCSVASYSRKMKQIVEKIEQNSKFIENERKRVTFNISDEKQIEAWETTIRNKGTPLLTFYESWNKLRNIKKNKQATNNEELGDYNLPTIKKSKKTTEQNDTTGPVTLFPSDSESDEEGFGKGNAQQKPKRGKRGGKNQKKKIIPLDLQMDVDDNEDQDVVQDFKASDW